MSKVEQNQLQTNKHTTVNVVAFFCPRHHFHNTSPFKDGFRTLLTLLLCLVPSMRVHLGKSVHNMRLSRKAVVKRDITWSQLQFGFRPNKIKWRIKGRLRQTSPNHITLYNGFRYSETSLIRHSIGPENNVGLGGCWIIECLLPYVW